MRLKRNEKKLTLKQGNADCINPVFFGVLITFAILLSIIAIALNTYIFQYEGNPYLIEGNFGSLLIAILIYTGLLLWFGWCHPITSFMKELLYFYLTLNCMLLMTYSVQYTPFPPIDRFLVEIDKRSYINFNDILVWMHHHAWAKSILSFIYQSIFYQMIFIPIALIIFKQFKVLREYYFFMISTLLIGFIFYYFFPTTAPASMFDSPYFLNSQKATGLKFQQIHQHLSPTTMDGGMVSLPSFHVIWAYLSLYGLRIWPSVCWFLFPINLLLALSCVVLGWHYPIDLVGSAIVIGCAHLLHLASLDKRKTSF